MSRRRSATLAVLVALLSQPLVAGATKPRTADTYAGATTMAVAGDLDRDGADDLLRVTPSLTTSTVVAFSGRTGAEMWSRSLPGLGTEIVPGRVGTSGTPGVLAVLADGTAAAAVVALDGEGALVWTARAAEPGGGAASYVSTIAGPRGGGTDLLFTRSDGESSTLVVVDGSDGTVRDLGVTVPDAGPTVDMGVVADTDRDGLDEVAIRHSNNGFGVLLTLVSGAGGQVWSVNADRFTIGFRPVAVGDLTGDGRGDVAMDWGANGWANPDPAGENAVYVFDGATGRLLWQARGKSIYATTSRAGRVRVVLGAVLFGTSANRTGVEATAFDARGRVVWTVRRLLGYKKNDELSSAPELGPIGDVDGDGTADLGYSISLRRPNGTDEGVISGRTGDVRPDPVPGLAAAGALDGRGTDRVAVRYSRPAVVTAWRGDTSARLWEVTFEDSLSVYEPERGLVVNLDGDRCADLLLPLEGTWLALAGATGTPLWVIGDDAPRVVGRKQYARTC